MFESILNRWRGTGDILKIYNVTLTGNILYGIYWLLVIMFFSLINEYSVILSFCFGLVSMILYMIGESFSWGKWIGWLVDYEKTNKPEFENKVGQSFPYIHYISNFIINQERNYTLYCVLALTIRGIFWWLLFLLFVSYIGLLPLFIIPFLLIGLGFGFPIACFIGTKIKVEFKTKYLNASRGWENQEFIYGIFHFLFLTLPLIVFNF